MKVVMIQSNIIVKAYIKTLLLICFVHLSCFSKATELSCPSICDRYKELFGQLEQDNETVFTRRHLPNIEYISSWGKWIVLPELESGDIFNSSSFNSYDDFEEHSNYSLILDKDRIIIEKKQKGWNYDYYKIDFNVTVLNKDTVYVVSLIQSSRYESNDFEIAIFKNGDQWNNITKCFFIPDVDFLIDTDSIYANLGLAKECMFIRPRVFESAGEIHFSLFKAEGEFSDGYYSKCSDDKLYFESKVYKFNLEDMVCSSIDSVANSCNNGKTETFYFFKSIEELPKTVMNSKILNDLIILSPVELKAVEYNVDGQKYSLLELVSKYFPNTTEYSLNEGFYREVKNSDVTNLLYALLKDFDK